MKIGVDIMGGDYAPQKTVQGAILALNEISNNTKLVLFGNEIEIIAELNANNIDAEKFEIINLDTLAGQKLSSDSDIFGLTDCRSAI